MLRNEIIGDLWRGSVGIAGSGLAMISSMHEDIDGIAKTASMILGCLASLAMLFGIWILIKVPERTLASSQSLYRVQNSYLSQNYRILSRGIENGVRVGRRA